MLGFQPVSFERAIQFDGDYDGMHAVNSNLCDYKVWDEMLDAAIIVSTESNNVYKWREQAEAELREKGNGAMSPNEVKVFCDRYMPSYEAYMGDVKFNHIDESKVLRFNLDPKRRPSVEAGDVENLESVVTAKSKFL